MVNWQIEVDKVIKESREGIFNISCEPKTVSAAILRVNHWCPSPLAKTDPEKSFQARVSSRDFGFRNG